MSRNTTTTKISRGDPIGAGRFAKSAPKLALLAAIAAYGSCGAALGAPLEEGIVASPTPAPSPGVQYDFRYRCVDESDSDPAGCFAEGEGGPPTFEIFNSGAFGDTDFLEFTFPANGDICDFRSVTHTDQGVGVLCGTFAEEDFCPEGQVFDNDLEACVFDEGGTQFCSLRVDQSPGNECYFAGPEEPEDQVLETIFTDGGSILACTLGQGCGEDQSPISGIVDVGQEIGGGGGPVQLPVQLIEDGSEIGPGESLVIEALERGDGTFGSPFRTTGIYISGVTAQTQEGCSGDRGDVTVFFGEGEQEIFGWEVPRDAGGACAVEGETTLFVPFLYDGGEGLVTQGIEARRIEVSVSQSFGGGEDGGVFVLGTEDCNGGNLTPEGRCQVPLYPPGTPVFTPPVNGVPSNTVIATSEADIQVVENFPIRVQDTREACGPFYEPGDENTDFALDTGVDAVRPFNDETGNNPPFPLPPFPLTVSSSGETFTVTKKACGVPRADKNGSPDPYGEVVERTAGGAWTPFFDVTAIEADFDPVADTTEFRSKDLDEGYSSGVLACQIDAAEDGTADRDQPFFEINSRPGEIKYTRGSNPQIDPLGRDIMVGCGGSKRGTSRRWSYLAYNLIHAPDADFRAETRDEIDSLLESINRVASCVDATFYARTLQGRANRLSRYYDAFVGSSPRRASRYFTLADREATSLANAVANSRDSFQACWTEAPLFVEVTVTPEEGDKPLNAYGDLLSQIEHIEYIFRAFEDELITPTTYSLEEPEISVDPL